MGKETITIATINAERDKFIDAGGLEQFGNTDVVLMQEVNPDRDEFHKRMADTDLVLAAGSRAMRLAVAVHKHIDLLSTSQAVVQSGGNIAKTTRALVRPHGRVADLFRDRGFLSAEVEFDGKPLHAVTSHYVVFPIAHKRADHLNQTPTILDQIKGSLVFGADANCYPAPTEADERMRIEANLLRVPLNLPTWTTDASDPKRQTAGKLLKGIGINPDAEMDALLWRNDGSLVLNDASVVKIPSSDHDAIVGTFERS